MGVLFGAFRPGTSGMHDSLQKMHANRFFLDFSLELGYDVDGSYWNLCNFREDGVLLC